MPGSSRKRHAREATFLESVREVLQSLSNDVREVKQCIKELQVPLTVYPDMFTYAGNASGWDDWSAWYGLGFDGELTYDAPDSAQGSQPALTSAANTTALTREAILAYRCCAQSGKPEDLKLCALEGSCSGAGRRKCSRGPGDFRSLPTAAWEAIHAPFRHSASKGHITIAKPELANAGDGKTESPEFTPQQMRGFIDTTISELRQSPHWSKMPPDALAALITDIKADFPDCDGQWYSKTDAIELMSFTGKRCGEILQLYVGCDNENKLLSSQVRQTMPRDYVALEGLADIKLNGERGFILEQVHTGRLRVELGHRALNRIVAVKPGTVRVIETAASIAAVCKLRDEGHPVSSLRAMGYSIVAIQLDSSRKQCIECFRPRHMCCCTYGLERM